MFRGKLLLSERVPSRELTYPTLGKVKSSTQYVSSLEDTLPPGNQHIPPGEEENHLQKGLGEKHVSSLEHKCRVILITHTLDDSEIPFPTTVWMYPKNLVDDGDFNYQPGEFTGFQKTITQYCKPNGTVDAPSPWSSPGSADRRGGSAVDSMSGDGWMSGIQNPQEWKRLPKHRNIWVFPKIVGFPPKSSILIVFSIIFTIHFGVYSYFWKNPCGCVWRC